MRETWQLTGQRVSRDVEEAAVLAVRGALLKCPHLAAYIKDADSEPITDGYINLHSDRERANASFQGRVDVQVKGRTIKVGKKPTLSFSFKRDQLKAYIALNGILFFLVLIDEVTGDSRPHFAILNPYRLDKILKKESKDKKRFSIAVKPLPTLPADIEHKVWMTLKHQDDRPGTVIDNGEFFRHIHEIRIHGAGSIPFAGKLDFGSNQDDYIVIARTDVGDIVLDDEAFSFIQEDYVIPKPVNVAVSAGDVVIEQPTSRRLDEDTVELALNDGLRLLLKRPVDGRQAIKLNMELSRNLPSRIQTLEFIFAMLAQGGFWFGNTFAEQNSEILSDEDALRGHLTHLRCLAEIFKFIGADANLIDLEDVTEEQHKQLARLYEPLVKQTEVKADYSTPYRILQPVGKWRIELVCFEGSKPDTVTVRHLFDPELMMRFGATIETEHDVKRQLATPYDGLPNDDFLADEYFPYTLNLRLDLMVEHYRKVAEYADNTVFANQTVLRLLHGADKLPERRQEFLDTAMALSDWLLEQEPQEPVYVINKHQIITRSRELTPEERDELRAAKRVGDPHPQMQLATEFSCAALLGDREEAAFVFGKINPSWQEDVKTWPVWLLYQMGDGIIEYRAWDKFDEREAVLQVLEKHLPGSR